MKQIKGWQKGLIVIEKNLQKAFTADDDTTCLYSVKNQPGFQSHQLTSEKWTSNKVSKYVLKFSELDVFMNTYRNW